ncbi:YqaJ viral recombinase family protein [uncultured Kocuria sp.]|nr:hypothetical protein D8M21_01990 [Kocuria sp. HSID16901]
MTRYRSLLYRGTPGPKPGTAPWRAAMTASKVSATFMPSRSPYMSYFSLWHEMAGNLTGTPDSDVLQRGRVLEPAIAGWFREQHPGWNVRSPKGRWWVREDDTRMAATPDFIVEQGGEVLGLLECKSAQDMTGWGKPGSDEVPPHYSDQCQWQMYCTGERRVYVAVIHALTFREYAVEYDAARVAELVRSARAFLAALEAGDEPSVGDEAHLATYTALRELHPDIDDEAIELPEDVATGYVKARVALKEAERAELAAKTRVAEAMGTAKIATFDGHPVAERRARGTEAKPFVQAVRKLPTHILDTTDRTVHTINPNNQLTQEAA